MEEKIVSVKNGITVYSPVYVAGDGGSFDSEYVMTPRAESTSTFSRYAVSIHVSGNLGKFSLNGMFLEWSSYFKHHYNPEKVATLYSDNSYIEVYNNSSFSASTKIAHYDPSSGKYADVELDVSKYTDIWVVFLLYNLSVTYCVQQCLTHEKYWKVVGKLPTITAWVTGSKTSHTVTLNSMISADTETVDWYYSYDQTNWNHSYTTTGESKEWSIQDSFDGYIYFKAIAHNEAGDVEADIMSHRFYAVPTVSVSSSWSSKTVLQLKASGSYVTNYYWEVYNGGWTQFSTSQNPTVTYTKADSKKTFQYRCHVVGEGGETYSNTISITVPDYNGDTFYDIYHPRENGLHSLKTLLAHNGGVKQ